ncbi:MAG TPA: hypothetical protein VGP55_04070 [Chitinophagaceae bacterium]|nr:hypothetical protein [Chitinophagaceae bacterium]
MNKEFHVLLNEQIIHSIISVIPDEWLLKDAPFTSVELHRKAYEKFLIKRFAHSTIFVKEAQHAREGLI